MMKTISRSLLLASSLVFAAALLPGAIVDKQRAFATPAETIQAIIDAAEHNDSAALLQLFGPEGKDILESGDPVEDKQMRAEFAGAARERLKIEPDSDDPTRVTFSVGEQDWPFPVPVIQRDGKWRLDPVRGRLEVLARRVGRNELTTMELCRGYVEAQLEYSSQDRDGGGMLQYAQKLAATSGKSDGLYSSDGSISLVTRGLSDASFPNRPDTKPQAYHGYYFRILKAQGAAATGGEFDYTVHGKMIGGFALIAWPAEYGVSGIQTFIINHEGLLYGQDLGANTNALVQRITRFNPARPWRAIELE